MSPKIALELGKIVDLSDRVARIAQGLLSYCRPSSATRMRLDFRAPVRKSLAMVEEQARRRGVTIEDRLPDHVPAMQANAHELEQVFLNLFLNALDGMPTGGVLRISSFVDSALLRDAKPGVGRRGHRGGIPEAIRERIFEPFFTANRKDRALAWVCPSVWGLSGVTVARSTLKASPTRVRASRSNCPPNGC